MILRAANYGDETVGTDPYGLLIWAVVSVVTSVKPQCLTEVPTDTTDRN